MHLDGTCALWGGEIKGKKGGPVPGLLYDKRKKGARRFVVAMRMEGGGGRGGSCLYFKKFSEPTVP